MNIASTQNQTQKQGIIDRAIAAYQSSALKAMKDRIFDRLKALCCLVKILIFIAAGTLSWFFGVMTLFVLLTAIGVFVHIVRLVRDLD